MLRNYFRVAVKNLQKNKLNSFLNVMGLAIGIAAFVIIALYVLQEVSYDDFHEGADRIYRVGVMKDVDGLNRGNASAPYPLADVLVSEYPEVELAGRFIQMFNQNAVVRVGTDFFSEEKFYFADQNILNVLTIPFIDGDPAAALQAPNAIVLTERTARKYFGRSDVLGETLTVNLNGMNTDYEITGVLQDCRENTHFKYDLLASLDNFFPTVSELFRPRMKSWFLMRFWTYVRLKEGASARELENKMTKIVDQYFPQTRQASSLFLQPIVDIHLHSSHDNEIEPNNDILYVYIFSVIAGLVLLIASINFMNLTTARSVSRAREVGLRKVVGARRGQLVTQFLVEAILTTFLAVLVACGFVELFAGMLQDYTSVTIAPAYWSPQFLLAGLALTLVLGFLSGLYPAFFLSGFQPVKILKGVFARSDSGRALRRGLVVVQMTITVTLLVGIATISKQLDFIRNRKLGFAREQVLLIRTLGTNLADGQTYRAFKKQLQQLPEIKGVTMNTGVMGRGAAMRSVYFNEITPDQKVAVPYLTVGHDFATTYGLEIVKGRDISELFASDTNYVYLVNETAVQQFDLNPVLGRRIASGDLGNERGEIIGIVKDFHYAPLHEPIGPLVIGLWNVPLGYVSVRVETGQLQTTIAAIEDIWKTFESNRVMDFSFLDDQLTATYRFEATLGRIVAAFAGLAMLIACLGLFGMALYAAEQRTKEIGIRKVLGASVARIMLSFTLDFVKLMVLANCIGWPIAFFLLRGWLNDFAYRTDVGFGVFLISGAAALLVALASVSYHAIKVGVSDPVKAIRYE